MFRVILITNIHTTACKKRWLKKKKSNLFPPRSAYCGCDFLPQGGSSSSCQNKSLFRRRWRVISSDLFVGFVLLAQHIKSVVSLWGLEKQWIMEKKKRKTQPDYSNNPKKKIQWKCYGVMGGTISHVVKHKLMRGALRCAEDQAPAGTVPVSCN